MAKDCGRRIFQPNLPSLLKITWFVAHKSTPPTLACVAAKV